MYRSVPRSDCRQNDMLSYGRVESNLEVLELKAKQNCNATAAILCQDILFVDTTDLQEILSLIDNGYHNALLGNPFIKEFSRSLTLT
jgi:hypothetical protein